MKSFQIRPISVHDSEDTAKLMCMLNSPTTESEMEKRIKTIISHPDYTCFVYQESGEIHGMIGIQKCLRIQKNGHNGRILTLIVNELYRNKGIGRSLVGEAEKWFREHGITSIVINSNQKLTKAHEFYNKLGYSKTGFRLAKQFN